jgi:multiple sugar transport system permease protein
MAQAIADSEVELGERVADGPVRVLRKGVTEGLFLAPAVVFFIGYQVWPIARVLWLSFTNFQFLSDKPAQWIGFANYAQALKDPLMWTSLWRAALFTMMFLPGTIILPLLLAILVDKVSNQRLATLYRVILLIPAVIPSTLIFVLWKWMYNYQSGPINHLLVDTFGLFTLQNAPQWLGGTALTLPAIAIMEVWWGLGYHTIFFIAGLAAIPKELSDAARIDGANEWQVFWHVIRPGLAPIMMILVVLRFGSAMAVIDEYLIFGGRATPPPSA